MTASRNPTLGPKRRAFQWGASLTVLLLPFAQWHGSSLLRIDFEHFSLHLFWQQLRIDEFYLVLFLTLALGLAFLLVTLIFGRVWCGWACPQTTLSDLAEWLLRRLGLQERDGRIAGAWWRKLLLHLGFAALALLIGANLVWYFVEPQRFGRELLAGELHYGAWITLVVAAVTVYLDLALIRRVMCRDFCPYGRFQTVLVDPGTLTLHLPESEESRCIKCGACVRSCPMGIDIRRGYQVECINCGRCLDACREVMSRRRQPGLIRYSFGLEGKGPRALLNPRTLLLTLVLCVLTSVLVSAVYLKPSASLKIARSHTAASRILENGQLATFFSAWVGNRGSAAETYSLEAVFAGTDRPLQLRGPVGSIRLEPGGNREIRFAVTTPAIDQPRPIVFILYGRDGLRVASAEASLSPP